MNFLYANWIFRGYETLDDFVTNKNCLYETQDYPYVKRTSKHKDKYIYILSKYHFEGTHKKYDWERFEFSPEFDECVFIFEDHEEGCNVDCRWFEVMRKRRRGVYIPDQTPKFYNKEPDLKYPPFVVPGYFIYYDKWKGKPFSLYEFSNPDGPFREMNTNRDIDVFFAGGGSKRTQRTKYINMISKATKKLKINAIVTSDKIEMTKYIEIMQRSKIIYNIMGIGYRTGREWEALINGALLINDDRTVNHMHTPGIEENRDFITLDPDDVRTQMKYWLDHEEERKRIAASGFASAWKVWDGCLDPYMASRRLAAKYMRAAGW